MPALTPNAIAQRLIRFQTYQEVVWGSACPATKRWMTAKEYPTVKPYRKSTVYPEARGSLAPGFASNQLRQGGEWKLGGYAAFEELPYYFQSVTTFQASASQGGGFFLYTYSFPTTAQPTPSSYTIEYNQTGYPARAVGCIGQKLSLKWEAEKEVQWDLSGQAKDIDNSWSGSPAVLSDVAITPVITPVTALAMDASGSASIGTNVYAGTLLSATFNFENNAKLLYSGGALTPQLWVFGMGVKADLELELYYSTAVRNFINSYMFQNVNSLIQLKATSGSNSLTVNFAGELADDPELFGQKDGAQTVKLKLNAIYDTNAALYAQALVQNTLAATL